LSGFDFFEWHLYLYKPLVVGVLRAVTARCELHKASAFRNIFDPS